MDGDVAMTMRTTARAHVTEAADDGLARTAFLKGQPVGRAFTVTFLYPCAHCHRRGTTAAGALWRTGQSDELYYLHSRCLASYKVACGLRSVEGRVARTAAGAVAR